MDPFPCLRDSGLFFTIAENFVNSLEFVCGIAVIMHLRGGREGGSLELSVYIDMYHVYIFEYLPFFATNCCATGVHWEGLMG